MKELIDQICALQSPGGTYLSEVHLPTVTGEDLNCFVTALVVRELTEVLPHLEPPDREELADSHRRALGYLLRSRYPVYEYTYAFYPPFAHPFWIGGVLPADADDTCVIGLELVRAEKAPPESLEIIAERYLSLFRAAGDFQRYLTEDWHIEGSYLTWFSRRDEENPLDLCVNTNALALLSAAGLDGVPGQREAAALVELGLEWAGKDLKRIRRLTPFYPDPRMLRETLAHAVRSGATTLRGALDHLDDVLTQSAQQLPSAGPYKCFSSAENTVFWTAPVIELARALRTTVTEPEEQP